MTDQKFYQPQYKSRTGEWCNIQGYRDDKTDTIIKSDNEHEAYCEFIKWIKARFKSHHGLLLNGWRDYDYRMKEV